MYSMINVKKIYHLPFYISMILILSAFSGVFAPQVTASSEVLVSYEFTEPTIRNVAIDGVNYDEILLDNAEYLNAPGEPQIPVHGAYILLPAGSTVDSIFIESSEQHSLGNNYLIVPSSEPVPISQIETASFPVRDEQIYSSDEAYPGRLYDEIGTYVYRGFQILVLQLYPVHYTPSSGELVYYSELTVSIEVSSGEENHPLYRGFTADKYEVKNKVDNPEQVLTYPSSTVPLNANLDTFDLLIITTDAFKPGFEPLKIAHDAQGILTEIVTLNDIGSTDQADIRTYIQDAYVNNGIEYVLLGGDDDVIPARKLVVEAWPGGNWANMPSDLYYACLDGSFNSDGDLYFGEPTDGQNGEDVDLFAEVYIGRACIGNLQELDNFVSKTLAYLEIDSEDPYFKEKLMVGELLWTDPYTWGGDYMDELINGSAANMYTTIGIPAEDNNVALLYDRDWSGNSWPKSEILSRINSGVFQVNHLGHGNTHFALKMIDTDADSLTNTEYCFVYSQACYAGRFDDADCFAEHMTIKTGHAAFAVIMNARYGWGVKGGTNGASQHFHRQFIDAVYGEDVKVISKANQDSKEDNVYRINSACMRWCYYQLNYFGDPALAFYNDIQSKPPHTPDKPTVPRKAWIDEPVVFYASADDPNRDQLYFKWDIDGYITDWLGPYHSGEEVAYEHTWDKVGTYEIKVQVKDTDDQLSEWSEPASIDIQGIELAIGEMKGGKGIMSSIINIGNIEVNDVSYTILINGGIVFGRETYGYRSSISGETELDISTRFLLGIGKITITVTAEAPDVDPCTATSEGILIGAYVMIK